MADVEPNEGSEGSGEDSKEIAHEPAGEDGFLEDVTQLYLNEIGATPLLKPATNMLPGLS